jgi:hypothetical protein
MTSSIDFIIQHLTALKAIAGIELNTNYLFVQAMEPVEFPFEGYKITDVTNRFRMSLTRDVKPKRYKIERHDGSNFVPMTYVEANAVARTAKIKGLETTGMYLDEYPIFTDTKSVLADIKWTEGIQPIFQPSYKTIKSRTPGVTGEYYYNGEFILPKSDAEKLKNLCSEIDLETGKIREPDAPESGTGQPGI